MEEFIRFSEENLWAEIWPELTLAMGAVLILLIDLFSSKEKKESNLCGTFAVLFQFCLLVYHLLDYLLINHTFDRSSFSGMLRHGFQGDVMRTFFLLSSLCVSILGNRFLKIQKLRFGEFHHLTMLATAGLMLLCQSTNFIVLFVALETVASGILSTGCIQPKINQVSRGRYKVPYFWCFKLCSFVARNCFDLWSGC